MKKKTFLLITLLISIVLNIKVVDAATELTCVYQDGTVNRGFKFTQDSSGDKKYYRYYDNDWYEFTPKKVKKKGKEEEYYKDGNYIKCPAGARVGSFDPDKRTTVKLSSKDKWLDYRQDGELIIETVLDSDTDATINSNKLTNLEELESCEELIPTDSELYKLLNKYMNIIRLIVPILLIIFGIVDFLKAMFSDEDTMTKSKKTFLKRLAAAVIVFIIPMFINLVLGIANTVWSNIHPETCVK